MNLFDRVKQKAGVISHMHSHEMLRSFNSDGSSYSTSAVTDNQEAFRALCEIVEEELTMLKQKMKTIGFLTEEDMKI